STLPIFLSCVCAREPGSAKLFRFNLVALKPHLHCAPSQPWVQVLSSLVKTVDCNQLGFELAAENPGRRIPHRAGHNPSAKRAVDVDRTARHDLRTGSDR